MSKKNIGFSGLENPEISNIFEDNVLIPAVRVPILVGKGGSVKKKIEQNGAVKILVQKDGDIAIKGNDALELAIVRDVVEAIGRGFNPAIAIKLFKEDYGFEIISIVDFGAKTKPRRIQIKGLVIGDQGKTKRMLERVTGTDICIYGKTVSIIGRIENIQKARRAVEMFLTGSKHGSVYHFLEREMEKINGK